MPIQNKYKVKPSLTTAAMSDIAFLLIVFFLVTTSFAHDKGLGLTLPEYGAVTKVPQSNISKVLINSGGEIMHDGTIVTLDELRERLKQKTLENPNLIVSIKTDSGAYYEYFVDVVDAAKESGNNKISIAEPY